MSLIDSYKLYSINSILGINLLIGYLKVSIKIIKAVNDIIKIRVKLNSLLFFFNYYLSVIYSFFFSFITGR